MAYSNTGTPRFYVNVVEWLLSVGYLSMDNLWNIDALGDTQSDENTSMPHNLFRTLPVEPVSIGHYYFNDNNWIGTTNTLFGMPNPSTTDDNAFIALLGHNLGTAATAFGVFENGIVEADVVIPVTNIVNTYPTTYGANQIYGAGHDGFSIGTFSGVNNLYFNSSTSNASAGSIVIGTFYDMPHSPELSLTMTREMDGVKSIRTKGGADLVNHRYTKPPKWGDLAPWELDDGHGISQELSRVGRRIWDLSFNYLQDSDIFPMVSSFTPYESTSDTGAVYSEDETNWHVGETLLDDDTFYNQVIHKTNGGRLPFIFQPDGGYNNPDGFAICKMNEFQFEQVANGVYNIKLKIREVW